MSELELRRLQAHTLAPISLTLNAPHCVLSGASGSGKTLLLRAIADLDPSQGDVLLNGASRQHYSGSAWRRKVAYIAADSQWWNDRVGDHFERVEHDILTQLGFSAAVLDWQVSRLSSGERQRLGLARALANQPEVLLLDEPTANLDADNCNRVEQIILHYSQTNNACALWVSHDAEQRRRLAQDRWVIEDGQVRREPPPWS
jgi:ABC-type iron transport system FetAB ATPase subunit